MIVEMRRGATAKEVNAVVQRAESLGLDTQLNLGTDKTVVALLGSNTGQLPTDIFAVLPGVESVARIMRPYKLASREFKAENSVVSVNGIEIGGERFVVMAGPCAIESEDQLVKPPKPSSSREPVFSEGAPSSPGPRLSAFRDWKRLDWSC